MRESEFLFYNPLHCLGTFLEDFVYTQDFPIDVKDAKTRRYSLSNVAVAAESGLTPTERKGLDIYDIGKINRLRKSVIEQIVELDDKICSQALFIRFNHVFFTQQKFIRLSEVTKKPIFDSDNKVIAILSYSRDITPYVDPNYLFECYIDLYCNVLSKNTAVGIQAFLSYLKVDTFFIEVPTKKELLTLLALRRTEHSKYAAKNLDISYRTVDEYKSRLRGKLKGIGLSELLIRLRTQHEHQNLDNAVTEITRK